MTFREIQDEIIYMRFKDALRTYVKRWVNLRYSWIWGAADWPFRYAFETDLAVVLGEREPELTAGGLARIRRVLKLNDDLGDPLSYVSPGGFSDMFLSSSSTGRPSHFTVVNGVLYLGPTPSASATYKISYEKRLVLLSEDNEEPGFPEEYHHALVLGGLSTGLKEENDPTWESLESEFNNVVIIMQNDLLPPDRPENLQLGRDMLGSEAWLA